ncbi:MAG: DndE family protein [Desulfamplus sp.]|nr:DndE family protein [Desulfamplus sp.]
MADRLYTTKETDEILSALRLETRLEKYIIARMAFSLSIVEDGKNVPSSTEFSGSEMKRPTFIGQDELFIKTLISQVYGISDISEESFYSNKSIIKNHIDNGAKKLRKLFEESGNSADLMLKKLVEKVEFKGRKEIIGKGFQIFLGREILKRNDVVMELNNTLIHANSHIAIMGKPGVGKTQFLLKILADIRIQSNFQTNFIYFDYKGDVADNEKFCNLAKVQVYSLMQGEQTLPINPFVLPDYDEQSINLSAREKAESFASINSKIGVVQKGKLADSIKTAYNNRADSELPYPDFKEVYDIARILYEQDGKKDDSLIEALSDLSGFNIFWEHGSEVPPIEKLSDRTLLIDLHVMPVLKELAAYLVIERLYKEMSVMPDSPVSDNKRTIRTILVIDEAHNYLGQKNIFLQRIIREGRSKGIVVFFASQSPNDYQQKFFNFNELLEFAYIFQCDGVSASSIQDILGCNPKTAKELQTEIARLEPWQVISRGVDKKDEFAKFTAEAFYKNY